MHNIKMNGKAYANNLNFIFSLLIMALNKKLKHTHSFIF